MYQILLQRLHPTSDTYKFLKMRTLFLPNI